MPSTSPKQARTMAAAAHNPAFAEKMGIPRKVARDFNQADKGGKMLKAKRPKPKGHYGDFKKTSRSSAD